MRVPPEIRMMPASFIFVKTQLAAIDSGTRQARLAKTYIEVKRRPLYVIAEDNMKAVIEEK